MVSLGDLCKVKKKKDLHYTRVYVYMHEVITFLQCFTGQASMDDVSFSYSTLLTVSSINFPSELGAHCMCICKRFKWVM